MPDERRPAPGEGQAFGNDALSGKPERPEGNQAQSRPQAAIRAVTVYRLKLKAAGFHPLPINGKRPAIEKWETKTDASTGEIELWEKLFPYAPSTGILTQRTPTIDIDILDPFAADTIEHLAGDHFGERGVFLTRFGRPPKRAIPLRTATPFKKQTLLLTAPNGAEHKIEGLCAGQQVVIDGIHPDTRCAYSWHGGSPGDVPWRELPAVTEDEMRLFFADALEVLARDYAWQCKSISKPACKAKRPTEWRDVVTRGIAEGARHTSATSLAGHLLRHRIDPVVALQLLQSWNRTSCVPPLPPEEVNEIINSIAALELERRGHA